MKFHPEGPSIPDALLENCDAGRVVFLCGAGVSMPSGMPDFIGLTKYVIDHFDPLPESEVMKSFRPWLTDSSAANVPLDQIFNLLHIEYGKDVVNALVTERLDSAIEENISDRKHDLIKRISTSPNGVPQIVTTNFDRLFEAGGDMTIKVHEPPAFPDLNFGSQVEGITYLHGRLVETKSDTHPYVLSSADFGRAYLAEGWATNFIRNLLERYTVVLVGYKAEDPPIKYLLQGLNHDGKYDRSKLYAFDRGRPEDIETKWRDRGVSAIAYSEHSELWKTMQAWAERVDDPRKWRAAVISQSMRDPKDLKSYERGQVAHVLRTVPGAKLFAEAAHLPHPEWVCVMDAGVRSAAQTSDHREGGQTFDPHAAYGLDDDVRLISDAYEDYFSKNDDLLVWRELDDTPNDHHRVAGSHRDGFEPIPRRLEHLSSWIAKSIISPVVAWWAVRQNSLHPRLIREIDWHLHHNKNIPNRAFRIWHLIVDHHRDSRNRKLSSDWYELKGRIASEGWTSSVLRAFANSVTPSITIERPMGIGRSKPPSSDWNTVLVSDIGQFDVNLSNWCRPDLPIPDDKISVILGILQERLAIAASILEDIEPVYFRSPSCYPHREVIGVERYKKNGEAMKWPLQLFERLVNLNPKLAHAYSMTWPACDRFYFRKLKLYAASKVNLYSADDAANIILSLDQQAFWDFDSARELLFLVVDRWKDFSQARRSNIIDRILKGPDQRSHWSDDEYPDLRNQASARFARYIQIQGYKLTVKQSKRLSKIILSIPGWNDGWATSTVTKRGSQGGWVATDEAPDSLISIPASEVIERAKEEYKRDFGSLTERRPFTGLIKINPRKALNALSIAARSNNYPQAFWSALLSDIPDNITSRLKRVFLNRLARLPSSVISNLSFSLSQWLEQKLVDALHFDAELSWYVYDQIVDGILSGSGPFEAPDSGTGVRNDSLGDGSSSTGMIAEALLRVLSDQSNGLISLNPEIIKTRLERLFSAQKYFSAPAVSIGARNLDWLLHLDIKWTSDYVLPKLELSAPVSQAAWSGLLQAEIPSANLASLIKPILLQLIPHATKLSWDPSLIGTAAHWLCFLRIFHKDEPGGLSQSEMRNSIRLMPEDTRNGLISWLSQVGSRNQNGWTEHVLPFINECWPREKRYITSASSKSWLELLNESENQFPNVLDTIKKFLVPLEAYNLPLYRFTSLLSDDKPITASFPDATLELLDHITPLSLARPAYEIPKILDMIIETKPSLSSDHRYLHLINLFEKS